MASVTFMVLAVVIGLVAFAAYYSLPVFPDTASNHAVKTVLVLGFKFINLVGATGGYFGFAPLNITRSIFAATAMFEKQSAVVERYRTLMDGVEVIVFKPAGPLDALLPGIVHIHGGGWSVLQTDMYAPFCEELVEHTGSVLVSVNYRLAPENVYPIPLEDCLTATRYFLQNARDYGVDANLIGINGDSAGGNLAMAVALKLSKEDGLPSFKYMALDYPALQAFDFNLPCYQKYETGPGVLTKDWMISYWLFYAFGDLKYYDMFYENKHVTKEQRDSSYGKFVSKDLLPDNIRNKIPDTQSSEKNVESENIEVPDEVTKIITDPLFAPLMARDEDLSLLPPTYLLNVEFDVLRDDGLIAAERLKGAGVNVTTRFISSEQHGYMSGVSMDKSVRSEIMRTARFINETLKI